MTSWQEYVQRDARLPEWPYPIRYGEENEITTEVLVLGGGIAGSHAAINAARKGARVVVVEKGMTKRSGAGGAGVDHWHGAITNPCCKISPEERIQANMDWVGGYTCGMAEYVKFREAWDALLDMEQMGMRIRDVDDEFKGADFRDEKSKLIFAYDYENRHVIRVWGYNVKPCLYKELKRLGVEIYDRVGVTSLLNEGGKQGARVIGATGVNVRTGEFYVFRAKATIISTGEIGQIWLFAPDATSGSVKTELNSAGAGQAIGWNAGAETVLMEQSERRNDHYNCYIQFGTAKPSSSSFGLSFVDANGKEIPWFDANGRKLETVRERFQPAPGQGYTIYSAKPKSKSSKHLTNRIDPDLDEHIRKGEFTLPLFGDYPGMPELERRVIFGMMIANEGRTRIPIYDTFTKAGFDPDKDMLQTPVVHPEGYKDGLFGYRITPPELRKARFGGFLVDWDLRTTLEGLYAAGDGCVFSSGVGHAGAATSGRYAGRKAAAYARTAPESAVDRKQVEAEKARVYAPLKQSKGGIGWKELRAAIARIMQDYCGSHKGEETLKLGLRLLKELEETEAATAYAANPHELGRIVDCFSLITCGEIIMNACLARKASSLWLDFNRLDYPDMDPPEWQKFLPMRLEEGKVKVRELPLDYHLKPPYAPTYHENYELHCSL